jgi:Family of unknown function (DUF5946)
MRGLIKCWGCGALVEDRPGPAPAHEYLGVSTGCWAVYGEILAKEYGDYRYPQPTHRLTVDAYAVQHPGNPERRSIQSVNGHLVSLYLVLERGMSAPDAILALGNVLGHADKFSWLEPPVPNGRLTMLDVVGAPNLTEHAHLVELWARDVWAAWALHHAVVKDLVRRYL